MQQIELARRSINMKIVAVFNDFRLRSKLEVFAFVPEIERFLAQTIASSYHDVLTTIINNIGKHTIKELHRVKPHFFIHRTNNFGITLGSQSNIT